jgi:hypothetical protein
MVQKFFQGIKGDIKEIIAPPKKALVVINEETGEAAEQAAPVVQMDDVEGNEDSESVENSVDLESDGRGVIRALPVDDVAEGGDVVPRADANFSGSVERGALPALPVEDDDVLDENVETQ